MMIHQTTDPKHGAGLGDGALALLLGVTFGALVGAWINVFGFGNFDPKFSEARIVPFFFDFLLLVVLVFAALGTGLMLLWLLRRSFAEHLKVWHLAGAGFVLCAVTALVLAYMTS